MLKTLTTVSLSVMITLSGFSTLMSSSLAEPVQIAQAVQCREDGSTIEMKKCAQDKYAKIDKELNQVYQKLMTNLSNQSQRKQRLISAQRSWIQFRDKSCSYEASEALGGSAEGLLLTNCLTRVTAQRTSELKQYLSSLSQR
ncbi:lysozyme inhibitor LprI family protein [Limnoraphis robusta]|uniref:lysozyme inhibitor LprI family protein n=1 Tax=Limnoraphis robusta TaxID=1118279 RepID=UPI002B1FC9A6|nr:lysozyme inhibitor LprI family protein [Limnoraphis robusta]MEA5496735.1 lysozyme inhibitor LprI family protein [Limnoraphis robusta BA-68 BA1]